MNGMMGMNGLADCKSLYLRRADCKSALTERNQLVKQQSLKGEQEKS